MEIIKNKNKTKKPESITDRYGNGVRNQPDPLLDDQIKVQHE